MCCSFEVSTSSEYYLSCTSALTSRPDLPVWAAIDGNKMDEVTLKTPVRSNTALKSEIRNASLLCIRGVGGPFLLRRCTVVER